MTYSTEELQAMIAGMHKASRAFYSDARRIGNHPFIEFTGLMNEYIGLCEAALASGIDFTETSIHGSGNALPMREHHRAYLEEKIQCIYGTSLEHILRNVPLDVRHVPVDVEQLDSDPSSNTADEGV